MSFKIKDNLELFKMIWSASKRDLFIAIPWYPIYSFAETSLAIVANLLLQLLFVTTRKVQLSTLVPGNFKNFLPVDYEFDIEKFILIIPVLIALVSLVKLISRFMSSYLTERAGHRTSYYLREKMLYRFLSSTGNKIDQTNSDKLANQIMQDTSLLQDAVSKGTMNAVRDFIVLIGIILSMLFISWRVFCIGTVIVVLMTFTLRKVSRRLNYYSNEAQKRQINIATRFLQTHRGSLVVNALRSHGKELSDLEELNNENYAFMRKSFLIRTFFSPTLEFIGIVLLAAVFLWRINSTTDFQSTNYSAMIILTLFSFRYIKNIANVITFLSDLRVVFERVSKYFKDYQEIDKNTHLSYLPSYSSDAVITKNISFVSQNGSKKILDNCSVKITKGQKVAFVGESGAGKTTFLRTIAGLLVPNEGDVSICENYLMAFQTPYVFRGTVQENIVYNQVTEITNRVIENCHDLVLALSLAFTESGTQIFLNKKLNFLGEGLSGGEKARVALARILFASPKLILLDEPTANLDMASSKFFWKAIDKWKAKDSEHTVIAVSHVLNEVLDFDYCYVFDNGKILKQGIPRDILHAQ